jgi:hypothetical protein
MRSVTCALHTEDASLSSDSRAALQEVAVINEPLVLPPSSQGPLDLFVPLPGWSAGRLRIEERVYLNQKTQKATAARVAENKRKRETNYPIQARVLQQAHCENLGYASLPKTDDAPLCGKSPQAYNTIYKVISALFYALYRSFIYAYFPCLLLLGSMTFRHRSHWGGPFSTRPCALPPTDAVGATRPPLAQLGGEKFSVANKGI